MSQRDPAASRREVTKRLIAAALSGAALSIVGAGEAEAQGQFRNIKPYDMRGAELIAVRGITAEVSADRVAIAAYGDDQAFIDAVERAVLYIRSQNVPIDVVWADNVHAGGQNAIDIYIEVHRPAVVDAGGLRAAGPVSAGPTMLRAPRTDRKALFSVEPIDPLIVHRPAFST